MSFKTEASILSDLDRCEHGRHVQDACNGCMNEHGGHNAGNPAVALLAAALAYECASDDDAGRTMDALFEAVSRYAIASMGTDGYGPPIGFDLSGRALIDPGAGRTDPDAWTEHGRNGSA